MPFHPETSAILGSCFRRSTFRALLGILGLLIMPAVLRAGADTDEKALSRVQVQVTWDQKIPMRDGIHLSATLYRDPRQAKPLPVILTMTPYIADHAAKQGLYFAQRGYVFVAVDLRGRGNSEGSFLPGQVEAKDGFDTVEWIAKQPWCDGRVATWGGSWLGFFQWSLAKEFPPHLKAMAPSAAVHPGVDYPNANGIFRPYMLRWLAYVHGRALNSGLFSTTGIWTNAVWEQVAGGRSFQDLEPLTGIHGTVFRTWLEHPREDAFWQAMTPRPEHYAKLDLPILTITGHHDADQLGALTYYERHMANGPKAVTAKHWLVIGPWDHSGTRLPKAEVGGINSGPAAVMNMEDLHKAWYDHTLKGGPRPEFLKDRVACFIMGRNTWIYASDLKQIEGAPLRFELDLTGAEPGDVTRGGHLVTGTPKQRAMVRLLADPKYLPPREETEQEDPSYLKDQRETLQNLPSQVMWHSSLFQEETVLSGRPKLTLQLACDQPDADLFCELQELLPEGEVVVLSSGSVRLRYRNGGVSPVLMVPGTAETVTFPAMSFFARAIRKGSRLRLIVSAGPYLSSQRNTHTGGDLASEPISKGRIAHITLFTGPGSQGMLDLPQPEKGLIKAQEPKK